MVLSLGTNGVRAKFDELNAGAASDFAYAFAKFCIKEAKKKNVKLGLGQKKNVKIGLARDMRKTSPCLFDAVASAIMEAGCDVLDFGLIPSPVAEWALAHYKADGLIIVTASHNPPEWNALKFVDKNGVAVSRERGENFGEYLEKPHAPALDWKEIGKIQKINTVLDDYSKDVLANIDKKKIKKLKIVADPGNGTSTLIAPALLRSLGAQVIVINEPLDGTFPNRLSEPAEANLQQLIKKVKETKSDFGVAWDGDADRTTFVDEKGRWIVGDKCVAISAKWALMNEKNAKEKMVATTSATSKVVEDIASAFGAKTLYTDVGAPYLAEQMCKLISKMVSGGEEVGGIVYPKFSLAKDGIFASCKLMEIVSQKPLSQWLDELPSYYNSKTKISANAKQKQTALNSIIQKAKSNANGSLIPLIGGFRLNFKDSWVLVRASGTEDYIRIFAEGKSEKQAQELMNEYKKLVEQNLN
ncbi:MAG: hypothetical protein WC492_01230 [Candidatus Micrarchaeia archaeon]